MVKDLEIVWTFVLGFTGGAFISQLFLPKEKGVILIIGLVYLTCFGGFMIEQWWKKRKKSFIPFRELIT